MLEKTIKDSKPNYGVVLVDMQNEFLKKVQSKDEIILTQSNFLDVCAEVDIPVLVFEYDGWGWTNRKIKKKLKNINRCRYLKKSTPDGFESCRENTNYFLKELWGLTDLCFTGVFAEQCVKETARGAIKSGFNVLTANQLIADIRFEYNPTDFYQSLTGSLILA